MANEKIVFEYDINIDASNKAIEAFIANIEKINKAMGIGLKEADSSSKKLTNSIASQTETTKLQNKEVQTQLGLIEKLKQKQAELTKSELRASLKP